MNSSDVKIEMGRPIHDVLWRLMNNFAKRGPLLPYKLHLQDEDIKTYVLKDCEGTRNMVATLKATALMIGIDVYAPNPNYIVVANVENELPLPF